MRRSPILFSLFVALSSVFGQGGDEALLERLLQGHTDLYGSLREDSALHSLSIEGTQVRPSGEYEFMVRKKRPNLIRFKLDGEGMALETGYNGRVGWEMRSVGGETSLETLTGDELTRLIDEADFEGQLIRHREKSGNQISLEGLKSVEGKSAYALQVVLADQTVYRYYLDPATYYLLRADRFNELGELSARIYYRDYREVGGFPFAFEVEVFSGEESVALTRVDEIEVNPGILRFYFEKPRL